MKKLLTLLLTTVFSCYCFATTYYVNKTATGTGFGDSWINAFIDLQMALNKARSGDTIKVAAGTYQPAVANPNNTDITFSIRRGITLLGGYPASGIPGDAQRNFIDNPTILSGALGNYNGYSYKSRTLIGVGNTDTTTIFDGFHVRNGGVFSTDSTCGGLDISKCKQLQVRNIVFDSIQYDAIRIKQSEVSFYNCVIKGSGATFGSGVISVRNNSDASFYNCIVTGNSAYNESTAIQSDNSSVKMIHCTIVNNKILPFSGKNGGQSNFQNCILWNNTTTYYLYVYNPNDFILNNHLVTVRHCITEYYTDEDHTDILTARSPYFVNILSPEGPDKKFFTADDGLQLTGPCSPALNSGYNDAINGLTTDILGRPRIYNTTADMGAYEMQKVPGNAMQTVYVNASAPSSGVHDGSSWQKAFLNLQEAMLYCSDTIKVAAGTYVTPNGKADSVLILGYKTVLLGGYPATGSPGNADRNPTTYRTLLTCDYDAEYNKLPLLKAYGNDSRSVIDGFEFVRSNYTSVARLFIDYGSKVRVSNCLFYNNKSSEAGGAVSIRRGSKPTITYCRFLNNKAPLAGAVFSEQSLLTLKDCLFSENEAYESTSGTAKGGALVLIETTGSIDSCRFLKNTSVVRASGMYSSKSNMKISRCLFTVTPIPQGTNSTLIDNYDNSNNIFEQCRIIKGTGTNACVYNDNSNPAFNLCFFDSAQTHVINTNYAAPVFNNCVSLGGLFLLNTRSAPVVKNSTLVNMKAQEGTGALVLNSDSSIFRAVNSIFWGHRLVGSATDIEDSPGTKSSSILSHCITRVYGTNGVNGNQVGIQPRFIQPTLIAGPDGRMLTSDDGLRLAACSPAVNAGIDTTEVLQTDITGLPRKVHTTVDIGAYEMQEATTSGRSYYVNTSAKGNNSGTSWQNAYTNLQSAICNACSDTIKVASGIYYPAVSSQDSSFFIDRGITLLGGYPATGDPGAEARAPQKYSTILSGNIGNRSDSGDNSMHVVLINKTKDTATIDGFIIRDASLGGKPITSVFGGGVAIHYSNVKLNNCWFYKNKLGAVGVGKSSYAAITRSIFVNNISGEGGAVSCYGDSVLISGCVFEENEASRYGGAVYTSAPFNVHHNVFYKNRINTPAFEDESFTGGGMYVSNTKGKIHNNTFVANGTSFTGMNTAAALSVKSYLVTQVYNNIFFSNRGYNQQGFWEYGAETEWENNIGRYNNLLQLKRSNDEVNYASTAPGFTDSLNPRGADGIWLTADDGFQLNPLSKWINKGARQYPSNAPVDILGERSVVGDTVDLGAYEYQDKTIAIAGKDTSLCKGDSLRLGIPGNPRHTYSWTSSPAGFNSGMPNPLVKPEVTTIYYLMVTNGAIVAKDTVLIDVPLSVTPSIIITAETLEQCSGKSNNFSATITNGGSSPNYKWYVNAKPVASASNSSYSGGPFSQDTEIKAEMTSSLSCATPATVTSNIIALKITPVLTPSVSIAASSTAFCPGTEIQFTTTIPENIAPVSYQWYRNAQPVGANTSTYAGSNFANADNIAVTVTSGRACLTQNTAKSNAIILTIRPVISPAITIYGNSTAYTGDTIVLYATIQYGGTQPVFHWQDSTHLHSWQDIGNSNTPILKYVPGRTGDKIRCMLTSNADGCMQTPYATSSDISFVVQAGNTGRFSSYPNPVTSKLYISDLKVDDDWQTAEIIGTGNFQRLIVQNIARQQKVEINVSSLKSGVYILVLRNSRGEKETRTFIKM